MPYINFVMCHACLFKLRYCIQFYKFVTLFNLCCKYWYPVVICQAAVVTTLLAKEKLVFFAVSCSHLATALPRLLLDLCN